MTFIRHANSQTNNLNVFGTMQTKGSKQDSNILLRLPMPVGILTFGLINYIIILIKNCTFSHLNYYHIIFYTKGY